LSNTEFTRAANRGIGEVSLRVRARALVPPLILLVIALLIWEFFEAITGEPKWIIPPFSEVITVAVTDFSSRFVPAGWVTLQEMIYGYLLAVVFGTLLAVSVFHSKFLSQALFPWILASQAVPSIVLAPIFVIWFGFGMEPKVLITIIIVFFPVFLNTHAGLGAVERESIDLMNSLGASKWQIFWKVRFFGALPSTFTGLKIGATISPIGAIVAEFVGASEGMGPLIIVATSAFKTTLVFAAIIYIALAAISLFFFVLILERVAIPWHHITRKEG
tara:strand:- start:2 stop:826 length:825 start_codon:yes stop_codon:yes gene_type:complete